MDLTGGRKNPPIERSVLILSAVVAVVGVLAYLDGTVKNEHLILVALLFPSIILHEISHGVVALWFGDQTAKRAGRLTLNPLRHIDAWGTIIVPFVLALTTGIPFGWAKPVPVDVSNMSRNRAMLVSLAGPATNIVICLIAALAISVLWNTSAFLEGGVMAHAIVTLYRLGIVNVNLAVFNLLPIPPLDGSAVVERFLPYKYWAGYLKFRQYSMIILLVLMLAVPGALNFVFEPAQDFWESLLPFRTN